MGSKVDKESLRCMCGNWTKSKTFKVDGLRIRGSECPNCGEGYFIGEDWQRLSDFRRLKDLVMTGKVTRAGNSFALRLPMSLVRAMQLEAGKALTIRVKRDGEFLVSLT